MFILLGSDGNKLESMIAKRFGHANFYILFDTETNNFQAVENCNRHNHDDLQIFLNKGIEAFIVGNIGPYSFEIINLPGIGIYLARTMQVQEAIEKFLKGELRQLSEPTVKRSIEHGHGSRKHHGAK